MPINFETPIATTTANGVTTVFPHSFTVLDKADLIVKTELAGVVSYPVVDVDYTVSGIGASAGSVTFSAAPANGTKVTRYRDTELSRSTDYQENGDLLAETLDKDFDRTIMMVQELFAGGKGAPTSIRVPNGETVGELPSAGDRALRILSFDSLGAPLLITGVDAGSAAALALDLASTASAAKGAGQVGFLGALSYTAGSVGYAIKNLPWSYIASGKPTTLSGYGITDGMVRADVSAALVGLKNRLINGNFGIKQDATYASGASVPAGGHIHDGWKAGAGGCTLTWATSGIDVVLTITAGTVVQVIDGVDIEGGTYTLSQAGTAQGRVDAGSYVAGSQTVTGKTAGTNISIEYGTGTVSKVQFEPGSFATAFERHPFELERCQRRYWVLGHDVFMAGSSPAGPGFQTGANIQFPIKMRAIPTISQNWSAASNIGTQIISAQAADGFSLKITSLGGAGAYAYTTTYSAGNTADARL